MPADTPTIFATSGGFRPGKRTTLTPGPLIRYALQLGDQGGLASASWPAVHFEQRFGDVDPHGSMRPTSLRSSTRLGGSGSASSRS